MNPTVRIYGPIMRGSWATLTNAFAKTLKAYGGLAGVVPTDDFDEDGSYDGADADVALVIGHPGNIPMAKRMGDHKLVYFMFAPNTWTIPKHVVNGILDAGCDYILTPSQDAYDAVLAHTRRLRLVPHGIDPDVFQPVPHPDPDGVFTILHHAGSSFERKGTFELIEAFRTWEHRDKSRLFISTPPEQAGQLGDDTPATWLKSGGPNVARWQYTMAHLVCQPSRAEGFSLCPFEARACGRPTLASSVGAHAFAIFGLAAFEYSTDGTLVESPLMCELGESAPRIDVKQMQRTMTSMFRRRHELLEEAMDSADVFRADWSWTRQTATWYFNIPSDIARNASRRRQMDTQIESEGT